ncbi:protein of unknown function [Pseudovibrio ascidiaceicola]|uniref:DUF4143 domain-containing protein n=1 Tax=Pseudovibrio ascidiaceicola TaxID=285279 RepID=A0A1I3WK07_9HYPH|nr:DUF4143 domain-containing protein [Pseudovibrio ascidiaceicola]SFK07868.1 protein of unknown function [Pseudovibrio ascidiaceicola]
MERVYALQQLDEAVTRSKVTVVQGLPRVGRTSILAEWRRQRPDTKLCREIADILSGTGVFILDHVDARSIDAISAKVREADEGRLHGHLVVAPIDFVTSVGLRNALPGLVTTIDVNPLQINETTGEASDSSLSAGPIDTPPEASAPVNDQTPAPHQHWLRGGFPESLEAETDELSMKWRDDMLGILLDRDYSCLGIARGLPLDQILLWLANKNGSELNEDGCPLVTKQEFRDAIRVFVRLGLVRRLPSYPARSKLSLTRNQKVFLRDTGILHTLLGIETWEQLDLQPDTVKGASFESYAIEALIHAANGRCEAQFYRHKNAEIDLVLNFPAQRNRLVAIECKVNSSRSLKSGFYTACEAIKVADQDRFMVHSDERPSYHGDVPKLDLRTAIKQISKIAQERQ